MRFWRKATGLFCALAFAGAATTPATAFADAKGKTQKRKVAQASGKVDRPPQYVFLAFDGSLNLDFWRESLEYARTANAQGRPLKFTYFLSGVYFLHSGNKSMYEAPRLGRAKSAIGWSGSLADIGPRVDFLNLAYSEKHEMASHANSHFDGSGNDSSDPMYGKKWTEADWSYEFKQFNDLIFGVYKNNGLSPSARFPNGLLFTPKQITGFRAPKLGVSDGLWPALNKYGFKYDTSKVASMTYWPQKSAHGIWNYPLAEIPVVGTAKKTLSMDFNFYVSQTRGTGAMLAANPSLRPVLEQQMYDSYMNYFATNYYGRRAPIHIGHHFSKWNGGAYWAAMKRFGDTVCKMKEVKCVAYDVYTAWLESLPAATLNAYRAGNFDKLPAGPNNVRPIAGPVSADIDLVLNSDAIRAVSKSLAQDRVRGFVTKLSVNGKMLDNPSLSREEVEAMVPSRDLVVIGAHTFNKQGMEIISKTHEIRYLNSPQETKSVEPLEARALRGDMAEAHWEDGVAPTE